MRSLLIERSPEMRNIFLGGIKFAAVVLAICLIAVLPVAGQGKKLQVITDQAEIHLNADPASPVVETLAKGATMTLASGIKAKTIWFYVYFISAQTGKTRAGYVLDGAVRKLYSDLKVVNISSEDEISEPNELDFSDVYRPIVAWGMEKNKLISVEGQPLGTEREGEREIVRYKRLVIAKHSLVEYIFESGRLVGTRFRLIENYADKNRYIDDYRRIKEFVTGKMGRPTSDRVIWQDPACKNDDTRWGYAISLGQLEFSSEWEVSSGDFLMTLAGENRHVNLGAEIKAPGYKAASF
jgi:hypothetical protein